MSSIPTEIKFPSKELPPKLTKGSGSPDVGSMPSTMPMWSNAFTKILTVSANARSRPKGSGAFLEILMPRMKSMRNNPRIMLALRNPSSSAMIANIKSEYDMGKKSSFSRPAPRPSPNNPPEPIPMSDCCI